ncbi:hypothetical protein MGYG_00852 [Nannizzia gypsea CBS 118893]|uniref:BRCT domain-containing protein n=1 Tax=Arthroderma gypseum (strain ATCC MYA-4604 / CBS 118893) TaxID=535722 RepID=E5R2D7_ARTGP|nr:hypothetical protein MGYG_00852 [Nannizzia gypsea CBS 118893]EFQ97813.1 hypothetical protein MGYG_00852 [Nannizzia gypsea CBS 118893]
MPPKDTKITPSLRQILTTPSNAALETFDTWNSVSTGHQRAEVKQTNSSGWTQVRSQKLSAQYGKTSKASNGEWAWLDKQGRKKLGHLSAGDGDIRRFMSTGKRRTGDEVNGKSEVAKRMKLMQGPQHKHIHEHGQVAGDDELVMSLEQSKGAVCFDKRYDRTSMNDNKDEINDDTHVDKDKRMFADLTIYINGSTMPLISDHRLKNILIDHGAKLSIGLTRRNVTHVILGHPNGECEVGGAGAGAGADPGRSQTGAGGGLAAGKMQREIRRVGGMGIKFVGVEWVLESIKAGCRLPEARFANVHLASKKQRSVLDFVIK